MKLKTKITVVAMICLATVYLSTVVYADKFPSNALESLKPTTHAKVVEVIAPDTIKLSDGQTVRLSGLHFIDYSQDNAGSFSLTVMKVLNDMLVGQETILYQTAKKDWGRTNRMGHSLGHIVRKSDNAWVQGTIISLGLAMVKTGARNPEMAKELYALEDQARLAKMGIWAKDMQTLSPEQAGDHLKTYQVVVGVIESVALKQNRTYLNFGKNWRDDFTVSISPEDKRAFNKDGMNPMEWSGKRVRVRGMTEEYNGPYIEIDHPEMIEVLD